MTTRKRLSPILFLFFLFFNILPGNATEEITVATTEVASTPPPRIVLTHEEKLWIEEHPSITVSNEFDWPPFDFALSGKPHGFGIDLMNLLSEYSGIQFTYINGYTWDQLVEKFFAGEIDLLHSLSITPSRQEKAFFSLPYYHSKNVLILRHDSVLTNDLNDLEGKIIALPKGWSSIEFFQRNYPKVHIVEVSSSRQAMEYVDQGKVFATVEQKEIAQYFMKKFGFYDLRLSEWIENEELQKTSSMHFAVLKSNPLLFQILVKAQNNIPLDTLEELKNKWFSREGRALGQEDAGLTPDERRFLEAKGSINFCMPPEAMPFSNIKNGQLEGMAADYIDIFSEKLKIPFHLTPTASWQETLDTFTDGDCEFTPFVMMPGRQKIKADLTSPLLSFQTALITRNEEDFIPGLQHFAGKTLGLINQDVKAGHLFPLYPTIQPVSFTTTENCLLQVSNGTIDGALLALPTAAYYIRHMGLNNLKIAGYAGTEGSIRLAIKKDQPELHSIMSKLIRSIPQKEIDTVYQKWISLRFEHEFDYTTLWRVFIAISVVVLLILLWNRQLFRLNKKIAEANVKLEEQSVELKRISITDMLTDLYNRRYADLKLEEEIARAKRYKGDLSLIITDLDNFKEVNDTWGHQVGDDVLQVFAQVLDKNTREADLVSRWGGEEFLIICPQTNTEGACTRAEKLRESFATINFDNVGKRTASFGVASYHQGESKNNLVQRADLALYRAKNSGRDRVEKEL